MTGKSNEKTQTGVFLDKALVEEAAKILGDVSAAAESSLRRLVEREKVRRDPEFQARLDATIDLATGFYQRHSVWGTEFSTL